MLVRCAGHLFEEQLGGGDAELVLGWRTELSEGDNMEAKTTSS